MKFILLTALLSILFTNPVIAQGYKDGTRAYRTGDYVKALRILRPLAYNGHTKAQGTLGWMYEAGRGLRRDYIMAFVWYDLAVQNGHRTAHRNRYNAEAMLNDDELKKARALSKSCRKDPKSCPQYSK